MQPEPLSLKEFASPEGASKLNLAATNSNAYQMKSYDNRIIQ